MSVISRSFPIFLSSALDGRHRKSTFPHLAMMPVFSHNTIRSWLSVLETSYIIHRLPAWHVNIRKQVVKAPKLHFLTVAWYATCSVSANPINLVFTRFEGLFSKAGLSRKSIKRPCTAAGSPGIYHYREARGTEIDLLIEKGQGMDAVEIKSVGYRYRRLF